MSFQPRMRIGILADIHEQVGYLRSAVTRFQSIGVNQVVLLGDVFETGKYIQESIQILREAGTVGVWGNHDLGLCHNADPEFVAKYDDKVVEYFAKLESHYELHDILFCHGLPTWDPTDPMIYYLGDPPWESGGLAPVFDSFPHRIFLIGHYHRWFLATTDEVIDWDGTESITLDPAKRYFLIVNAVLSGWCAVLDTESNEFIPLFVG